MKRDQKEKRIGRAIRDINKGERGGGRREKSGQSHARARYKSNNETTIRWSGGLDDILTPLHITSTHKHTPLTFRS